MQYPKEENAPPADDSDLPELTPQEYAFVLGIAKGEGTQSAVYRTAYPAAQTWKNESVWTAASRLIRKPEVAQWIAALREGMAKEIAYTREQMRQDLEAIKQRAMSEGKYIAAHHAVQTLGKLEGHIGGDRKDEPGKGKDSDLLAQIEKNFGKEAAVLVAKRLGLTSVSETRH